MNLFKNIKKPEGLTDEEWLEIELDRFEETGEDLVAFKKKHITFLRQTITSAEFKDLKITVESLEVKLNEKEKTDFWMDILAMLFSTAFTALVKAIGQKWVKSLGDNLLKNHKSYQLMFSTEHFRAAVLKTEVSEIGAFSKTTGMFFKEMVPTGSAGKKLAVGAASSAFANFVMDSKDELVRLSKALMGQEKARPSNFFEYQKNLIFNEELNLPDMEKKMNRFIKKTRRKVEKVDMEDSKAVVDSVVFLRNAMPFGVHEDSDLANPDFRRLMVGLFLGYGVALGRHMVIRGALVDFKGDTKNFAEALQDLTSYSGLLAMVDYTVEDVDAFDLINSTQALKLASNIPALKDHLVGKAEKDGHHLLKIKKGTFLGDYLLLEPKDLMFMLYNPKNPFLHYLKKNTKGWEEVVDLVKYEKLAKEYHDAIFEGSIQKGMAPINNMGQRGGGVSKDLEERVKEASKALTEVFREKYLPEIIESMIRPILLQYVKDFEKNRKNFGDIQEVAEAFQKEMK